ncbi:MULTISPECIES: hypothetical protein [unclassified Halomonas]|uniref:hypothetical protein n=1 Tax=unclassified Halomonas TaxID=2609666 RepID=UPI0021E4FA27|nr:MULTISPECIES: hypothetical protein [unclassified Halomonas]UYF99529.1 hypothetical protein OCT39_15060 [Halomonas sp. GD1P12]WNL39369.1 hypothetical protein RN346_02130 [Halomonas sp. PAMB 3232]WNL42721.1 hypothetical protein RN347_02175 [Halomonas sp. PAMB 3264]
MKKFALFLSLAAALTTQGAFAQSQACSSEALMAANQNVYDQLEAYAANQMQQGKTAEELTADMEAITSAGGVQDVLSRHQDELELMEPGSGHEPSQALCDDMYAMIDDMQAELDARQ